MMPGFHVFLGLYWASRFHSRKFRPLSSYSLCPPAPPVSGTRAQSLSAVLPGLHFSFSSFRGLCLSRVTSDAIASFFSCIFSLWVLFMVCCLTVCFLVWLCLLWFICLVNNHRNPLRSKMTVCFSAAHARAAAGWGVPPVSEHADLGH